MKCGVMILLLAALLAQTWRLDNASRALGAGESAMQEKNRALFRANEQLLALTALNARHRRAQAQLSAAAERNAELLRQRQRRIEELTGENEVLRRWAGAPLPAALIRLRQRPVLSGGAAYREWLSRADAVPAAAGGTAK